MNSRFKPKYPTAGERGASPTRSAYRSSSPSRPSYEDASLPPPPMRLGDHIGSYSQHLSPVALGGSHLSLQIQQAERLLQVQQQQQPQQYVSLSASSSSFSPSRPATSNLDDLAARYLRSEPEFVAQIEPRNPLFLSERRVDAFMSSASSSSPSVSPTRSRVSFSPSSPPRPSAAPPSNSISLFDLDLLRRNSEDPRARSIHHDEESPYPGLSKRQILSQMESLDLSSSSHPRSRSSSPSKVPSSSSSSLSSKKKKCVRTVKAHDNQIRCLHIPKNGPRNIYSGSVDSTIREWSLPLLSPQRVFRGHSAWVNAIISITTSSHNPLLISASSDQTTRVWSLLPSSSLSSDCLLILRGHSSDVTCLATSAYKSHIFSGSNDETLRGWDKSTGQCVSISYDTECPITCLAGSLSAPEEGVEPPASVADLIISGSQDGLVRLWDPRSNQCVRTLGTASSSATGVSALHVHGHRLFTASGNEGTVRIWDLRTFENTRTLRYSGAGAGSFPVILSLATKPDGNVLYSAEGDIALDDEKKKMRGNCQIKEWNVNTGECLQTLKGHTASVYGLETYLDNYLISADADFQIKEWE